jgi:hypothetical protein
MKNRPDSARDVMALSFQFHLEGQGEQLGKGHGSHSFRSGEDDRRVGMYKLRQHLSTCAAGRAASLVEVGHCDARDANARTKLRNSRDQRGALGADSKAVTHVFHVSAAHDGPIVELYGGADAEARVGRIGLKRGLPSSFEKLVKAPRRRGWFRVRHEIRG